MKHFLFLSLCFALGYKMGLCRTLCHGIVRSFVRFFRIRYRFFYITMSNMNGIDSHDIGPNRTFRVNKSHVLLMMKKLKSCLLVVVLCLYALLSLFGLQLVCDTMFIYYFFFSKRLSCFILFSFLCLSLHVFYINFHSVSILGINVST